MSDLSHVDESTGAVRMVDVGGEAAQPAACGRPCHGAHERRDGGPARRAAEG